MNLLCLRSGKIPNGACFPMHLHFRESQSGMESSQTERSNGDHDAVQDDKVGLILHDRVAPSVGHLADTEDTTSEDGQVCEDEAAGEQLERGRVHELDGRGFKLRSVGVHPEGVVADYTSEDEESKHLPCDTGHHEIVAHVLQ